MIGQRVRPALILGRYNIGAPGAVGRYREHPSSTLHPPLVLDGLLRQVPGRAHGEAMTYTIDRATEELLTARIAWLDAKRRRAVRDDHANRVAEEGAWAAVWRAFEAWDDERGNCE